METSLSPIRKRQQCGFTLMETMIAIVILSVGMLSLAGLMSKMTGSTETSRYMSMAAMLASEKLEDLNRLSPNDPELAVTAGSSVGNLTSDVCCQTVTVGANTEVVDYYDEVRISAGNGNISETLTGKNAGGATTYNTVTHQPDGTITSTSSTTAPTTSPDSMTFKRRWVIEKDTPTAGVRRVTVAVRMVSPAGPGVNFQMSMVRP
jgi:prepilin-type N-terminal cleavage/methylation domain-containing protein